MADKRKKVEYITDVILEHPEVEESDSGYFKKSGTAFFHEFGLKMEHGGCSDIFVVTCAIIEDCESGQIYMVHPDNIKFIKN